MVIYDFFAKTHKEFKAIQTFCKTIDNSHYTLGIQKKVYRKNLALENVIKMAKSFLSVDPVFTYLPVQTLGAYSK